jgi:transcriptional regulator with XRE-family HTH domain
MRDSFGARLRRHREDRHVSLADVAEQTKIKSSLLDGLERDDISQWPAGIFRRAYVRAYAAAIGFDPDAAVREFVELHPDPVEVPDPAPPPGGLRGLFGSLRRRTPVTITPSAPAPPSATALAAAPAPAPAPEVATATAGKRPPQPEPAIAPAVAAPAALTLTRPAPPAAAAVERAAPDFLAAATICTELGRVEDVPQVMPLLGDAATLLGARGLIVWVWDAAVEQLKPALVHGYSAKVRARLRGVSADADNVTAAAYRAGAPLATNGALAVPLLAPSACAGVLALEVEDGREQDPDVRALATFFAAMLAQLVGVPAAEAAGSSPESTLESPRETASARPS